MSYPDATMADVAEQLNYTSPDSLERTLYRGGNRDLVHRLIPGRKCVEDISGKGVFRHRTALNKKRRELAQEAEKR